MTSKFKHQELQEYLDSQLAGIIGNHNKSQQKFDVNFDSIEDKLQKIENKLIHLKSETPQLIRASIGMQTTEKIRQKNNRSVGDKIKSQKKEKELIKKQCKKQEISVQATPVKKQLNIVSKIMSEAHLIYSQKQKCKSKNKVKSKNQVTNFKQEQNIKIYSGTETKKSKMFKTTSKKSNKSLNFVGNTPIQKNSGRQTKQSYNHYNSSNTVSGRYAKNLQKQIQNCWKSNAQLKKKINQLKGYQNQFWKLKKVFDRCEILRKKKMFD